MASVSQSYYTSPRLQLQRMPDGGDRSGSGLQEPVVRRLRTDSGGADERHRGECERYVDRVEWQDEDKSVTGYELRGGQVIGTTDKTSYTVAGLRAATVRTERPRGQRSTRIRPRPRLRHEGGCPPKAPRTFPSRALRARRSPSHGARRRTPLPYGHVGTHIGRRRQQSHGHAPALRQRVGGGGPRGRARRKVHRRPRARALVDAQTKSPPVP